MNTCMQMQIKMEKKNIYKYEHTFMPTRVIFEI